MKTKLFRFFAVVVILTGTFLVFSLYKVPSELRLLGALLAGFTLRRLLYEGET